MIAPVLMWKVSRMSGERMPNAPASKRSTVARPVRMSSGSQPAGPFAVERLAHDRPTRPRGGGGVTTSVGAVTVASGFGVGFGFVFVRVAMTTSPRSLSASP